jgi:TolB-like protein
MKREKEVDRTESITHQTGRRLDRVIMLVLVGAVAYFIWERQSLNTEIPASPVADVATESAPVASDEGEIVETEAVRRSIAVLPFVNMSSDNEQEYFADGLTEEILNSLAKTPDLLVAARTSSFGFKGSTESVPVIAAALGVDHVLEGSVRRGGDTLRITAQLIRATDGFHLWSETYDRTMEDIIAIQEEIAVQIATALEPGTG